MLLGYILKPLLCKQGFNCNKYVYFQELILFVFPQSTITEWNNHLIVLMIRWSQSSHFRCTLVLILGTVRQRDAEILIFLHFCPKEKFLSYCKAAANLEVLVLANQQSLT